MPDKPSTYKRILSILLFAILSITPVALVSGVIMLATNYFPQTMFYLVYGLVIIVFGAFTVFNIVGGIYLFYKVFIKKAP